MTTPITSVDQLDQPTRAELVVYLLQIRARDADRRRKAREGDTRRREPGRRTRQTWEQAVDAAMAAHHAFHNTLSPAVTCRMCDDKWQGYDFHPDEQPPATATCSRCHAATPFFELVPLVAAERLLCPGCAARHLCSCCGEETDEAEFYDANGAPVRVQ